MSKSPVKNTGKKSTGRKSTGRKSTVKKLNGPAKVLKALKGAKFPKSKGNKKRKKK